MPRQTPWFLVIAILLMALSSALAQEVTFSGGQAIFGPIPEETRANFIERLRSVVRFQATHNWERLYDLLALPDPKTKTEFVARFKKYDRPDASFILEFRPDLLMKLPENPSERYEWIVSGCANYRVAGRVEPHHSSMYAVFRDGSWYFSEVMINIRCGPSDPDPCQQKTPNEKQ